MPPVEVVRPRRTPAVPAQVLRRRLSDRGRSRRSVVVPHTLVSTRTADGVRLAGRVWDTGFVKGRNELVDEAGSSLPAAPPTYVVGHGFTGSTPNVGCSTSASGSRSGARASSRSTSGATARSGGGSTLGEVETADVAAAAVVFARERFTDGPVVIAGWSMGGSVVLRHAGLGGDADAVVSVSSPGLWYERGTPRHADRPLGGRDRRGAARCAGC